MKEAIGSGAENVQRAVMFVESLELPREPRRTRGTADSTSRNFFDETKNQAMVVGSDIVSFVSGVAPEYREFVVNCSLLAQLAANRRVPAHHDIRAWYEVYFDTLAHLGWVTQERGFSEHREIGDDFEAHRAILQVASVVLGSAASALAVVEATLDAMRSMSDGPWMTLFKRESQAAKAARFQVTVAEPGSNGGSMLSLLAFELDAKSALTQVLFFNFRSADVTLRHASGRVTVNAVLQAAIFPVVLQKVSAYAPHYIEVLPI